ncbi:hypothetical protein GCM10023223_42710 [Stackebrandtia albiflava]
MTARRAGRIEDPGTTPVSVAGAKIKSIIYSTVSLCIRPSGRVADTPLVGRIASANASLL